MMLERRVPRLRSAFPQCSQPRCRGSLCTREGKHENHEADTQRDGHSGGGAGRGRGQEGTQASDVRGHWDAEAGWPGRSVCPVLFFTSHAHTFKLT